MRPVRAIAFLLTITTPVCAVAAQGADVSLSPFVSFLAPTGMTPLAGLALGFSDSPGFAVRISGRTALRNTYTGAFGAGSVLPPWGADADAVLALSGRAFGASNRSVASFVFVGRGMAGADSADKRIVTNNWSYGIGTVLPLGSIVDLFADSRWRMQRFVLPTAKPRPEQVKELRFGLTFHMGKRSAPPRRWPR